MADDPRHRSFGVICSFKRLSRGNMLGTGGWRPKVLPGDYGGQFSGSPAYKHRQIARGGPWWWLVTAELRYVAARQVGRATRIGMS
jgi:hypothetical protein